jgi:dolichyl-phosphate-mannose--protein O-mannosyl transferase
MIKFISARILFIIGVIVIIAGIIFIVQSNSLIGPSSSFMYSNPQWTVYGFEISIAGIIILACSVLVYFIR